MRSLAAAQSVQLRIVAMTGPRTILVIRHAEKPDESDAGAPPYGVDAQGNRDRHSLTTRGWQRSGALAVLLAPVGGRPPPPLGTPDRLIAISYGGADGSAIHRSYETIAPLSDRLGVPIETPRREGQEGELVSDILARDNALTLVCWDHVHLPAIASHVPGIDGAAVPAVWPDERFDVIWCFARTSDGDPPRYAFAQVPQNLLRGDQDSAIPA